MPVSKTGICNMALAHVGISKTIGDVDTEKSSEAARCRLFYDHCLELLLEMQIWGFAKEEVRLQLLGGTAPEGWEYWYKYPNTAILAAKIKNPRARQETLAQKIPFEVRNIPDGSGYGKAILTDESEAVLVYNKLITDVNLFSATFRQGLSFLLASHIAMPLRVDNNIALYAQQQFSIWAGEAAMLSIRESQPDAENASEFELARS